MHHETVSELVYQVNVLRGLGKAARKSRTAKNVLQFEIDDRDRYSVFYNTSTDSKDPAKHNHITRGTEKEITYWLEGVIASQRALTFDH